MLRLFINGIAASAGGGLTYLRNVVPQFAQRSDVHTIALVSPELRAEFRELPNLAFFDMSQNAGSLRRFMQEQTELPGLIRRAQAQVLISAGNFALWNSPVPQILLSRNSLYTSADFMRDLRRRGEYGIWLDTVLKGAMAKKSIGRADITVAPSQSFADELHAWSGQSIVALHHGFDLEAFTADTMPLPAAVKNQLEQSGNSLRLLFVSHYNYYRNFETLFRAMPLLSSRLSRKVKLFLTCCLQSGANPGPYRAESAAALADACRNDIVELGSVPYRSLHQLYRACNIYVTPAYAESFAHPLIEAMSSGLPVVASDLPVHREICGDAALYFSRFSPSELADRVMQLENSAELSQMLSANGERRARDFSWREHVDHLVELARQLLAQGGGAD